MTSFLSDILLPFPNSNDLNSRDEEFGQLQTSSGNSKKLKFDGLLLFKKYIPSAKTLYSEDLLNIFFNKLSENLPNDICHF